VLLAVLAAIAAVAAACGSGTGPAPSPGGATGPDGTAGAVTGTVTVFAAASLTEAFTRIGRDFEADHPGTRVVFSFAASSALVTQITQGAPADVFAAADETTMAKLTGAGATAGEPVTFARNRLAIMIAPGNPKRIASVADLADPKLIVLTCSPQVPIGAYAAEVFRKAGVTVRPSSLEADVKAVVTKVTAGEADAGIVYATDVAAASGRADGVDIPTELNVTATYPVAVTRDAPNPAAAAAFVSFVAGPRGQDTLASFGFAAP